MRKSNMRVVVSIASLRTAVAAVVVYSCIVAIPLIAAPAETPDLGTPAAVLPNLVTMELHFPAAASEGKFHVQKAQIVKAMAWGDAPRSKVDDSSFSLTERQVPFAWRAQAAVRRPAGNSSRPSAGSQE
jgi:hypothetical protein